jgi:hypothetical protein
LKVVVTFNGGSRVENGELSGEKGWKKKREGERNESRTTNEPYGVSVVDY